MVIGVLFGLVSRLVLSIIGGARMEGFLTALLILNVSDAEFVMGFFIAFIGTRSLSIPADVFVLANSRRDPHLHGLKTQMVSNGLGHVLVKQMALMQTLIGGTLLLVGSFFIGVFNRGDGLFTILMSPFGIIGLQLLFLLSKRDEKEKGWVGRYLIGLFLYSSLALTFVNLGDGFGMLIVINLLFLSLSDFWVKGKIQPQLTKYQVDNLSSLPWGYYSISQGGLIAGFISGLLIGCPTSIAAECLINPCTKEVEKLHVHTCSQATSEVMSLLLWIYFGYSRSSYADALGKAGVSLDPSSALPFALSIIILSLLCLLIIENLSYLYLTGMRLIGKLINLICCVVTIALCTIFVGFIPVLLGVVAVSILNLFKLPEESKLGVMGMVPLVSINWLSFVV